MEQLTCESPVVAPAGRAIRIITGGDMIIGIDLGTANSVVAIWRDGAKAVGHAIAMLINDLDAIEGQAFP